MPLFFADYNCHLLPYMQELFADPYEAAKALLLMHEKLGIRRFYMMPRYDKEESPITFCLRRKKALDILSKQLPDQIVLKASVAVLFSKGLFETAYLERLLISRSRRLLPIEMPLTPYEDWMDEELNHLLYVRHIKPIFLSFERCILLYPKEIVQKLMRIDGACFQFSFSSLEDERIYKIILLLLRQGAPICFGSGMNSLQKVQTMEFNNSKDFYSQPFQRSMIEQLRRQKKLPF